VEKGMRILVRLFLLILPFLLLTEECLATVRASQGFTQEDRERLIRLETTLKVFMDQTNRRFEELREDMNKRFEQMMNFLWMLTGIFTTLTVGVIGFAYWDRRTILRKARDEALEGVERERLSKLLEALKELAKDDLRLLEALKKYGFL
jgi:hypothetical protein